ncbi:MAG: hypothetical protein HZB29_06260 [Nitrospinae bacterium]|nr:hypothetical protein [Nitrospinota bacterium]
MSDIGKKIVTDDKAHPVAVQISYADWMEIERNLPENQPGQISEQAFGEALKKTAGLWKEGDGLRYQLKLRGEWGAS